MSRDGGWSREGGARLSTSDPCPAKALRACRGCLPPGTLGSPPDTHLARGKIGLETQPRLTMGTALLCPIPLPHHVRPEDISWCFSSKNENQAEVIPTENKKHTNAKPFLWWTGHCNQINFLSVNVNKLLLLWALYNQPYLLYWRVSNKPSEVAYCSLPKCSERRERYILKNVLLMKRVNIFV